MKILYDTANNPERKELAESLGQLMGQQSVYDKHTKSYTVGKVCFHRHGVIEGPMSKQEVEVIQSLLRGWEIGDQESQTEYDAMKQVDEYQIPDDPQPAAELDYNDEASVIDTPADTDLVNPDDVSMTITVSNEGITNEVKDTLLKLIDSHRSVIQKALGADSLGIITTEDKIEFPWFRHPSDNEENTAYYDLVTHLIEKAKTTKLVYDPVKGEEKYVFSRFLYRLGIDGDSRKTREILMRNLEGSAWKNLTWKRKRAERLLAKEA